MQNRRQMLFSTVAAGFAVTATPGLAFARVAASGEAAKVNAFYDAAMAKAMRQAPELATGLGLDSGDLAWTKGLLSDRSFEAIAAGAAQTREQLTTLRAFDRKALTGMDAVYEASTTRLSAVVHHLSKKYGWLIDATDKAAGCNDGRVAWIAEYALSAQAIAQAMGAGATAWRAKVRAARLERRKKAAQAERAAAQANAAHRTRHFHIDQSSLFEGPTA